jgi:hypothetical protein
MFAFLTAHRGQVFPDEDFADLFPSGRGRPSVPATVMAAVIALLRGRRKCANSVFGAARGLIAAAN